jgi:hypothetical protein
VQGGVPTQYSDGQRWKNDIGSDDHGALWSGVDIQTTSDLRLSAGQTAAEQIRQGRIFHGADNLAAGGSECRENFD